MQYLKGDKFVWKPINRATNTIEENHPHYNKIVTIIDTETLNRFKISVDDFPQCNFRESKNQFCADKDELIPVTIKQILNHLIKEE